MFGSQTLDLPAVVTADPLVAVDVPGLKLSHANVPLDRLPESRRPLLLDFVIGRAYIGAGILLLRLFEFEGRRTALELETV